MIVARITEKATRHTIEVSRWGITTKQWRPRVGGGWYVKHTITFPWWLHKNR